MNRATGTCPSFFFNKTVFLWWFVVSLEGIENTAGLHVSCKYRLNNAHTIYPYTYDYIHVYINCAYLYFMFRHTFVKVLLTGALISSNLHDISHHVVHKSGKQSIYSS
jgi:hypothetical protein